ncbi:MAG: hypothetical protein ABSB26_04670 [Nitrososphaerales archaeon]
MKKQTAILLLAVILLSVPVQALSQRSSTGSASAVGVSVLSHSVFTQGLLNLTFADLLSLVGGSSNMSVQGFSKLIKTDFWPSQTRIVGLDIGWTEYANTTSSIPFEQWIDDFLTAADQDNISVAFHLPDWGAKASGQSWWSDVEAQYPFLRTDMSNGEAVNESTALSLILNSPIVVNQLKRDLSQLLSYYGAHQSWVGLVSDSLTNTPESDELLSTTGFDEYSISAFANSSFYLRTVNGSGYYTDGTKSALWTAFNEPVSSPELVSGYWQSPDYLLLYNGSESTLGVRISVPVATRDPLVRLYLGKTGSPTTPIVLSLVPASNVTGFPLPSNVLANATLDPSDIPSKATWTAPLQFDTTRPLASNVTYWILLNTDSGNQSNAYQVWYRDFNVDNSAIATQGYKGTWYPTGSAIAWITNSAGEDVQVYPYQTMGISRNDGSTVVQQFTTGQALDVRTIFVHVADKLYSTVNSTLQIVDNLNSSVVASVSFSQASFNGTYWWIPISLPEAVHLQANHSYNLVLKRVASGNGWQWHYLQTDPSQAGFEGKSKVQLFRLESYSILSMNVMHIGPPGRLGPENGFPGATNTTWYAQEYTVSVSAPLTLVQANVEKYCQPGSVSGALRPCPAGQHPGDLVIQVREDNGTTNSPSTRILAEETIPESRIPWGRVWVNATGWNLTLNASSSYWIVLSTINGTMGGYYPWKEESAYQHLILRSSDGGLTWSSPREPADMLVDVFTTAQSFTTEPEFELTVMLGSRDWVAQSIEVARPTNVSTVLVFLSRFDSDPTGMVIADVRADNGYGQPSQMILATGTLGPSEDVVTWKGIWAVNLNYPITLQPGVKYWLVFRSLVNSEMAVQTFAFTNDSASYGGSSLGVFQTQDSGRSWSLVSGRHSDLIFGLAYSPLAAQKPGLKELTKEIESKQLIDGSGESETLGWRAYLTSSTSRIETALLGWLNQQNVSAYLTNGSPQVAAREGTWISFDANPPSLFMTAGPGATQFDLYPVVNLAPGSHITVQSGAPDNSVPVLTFSSEPNQTNGIVEQYSSVIPSLDRSVILLNVNPVAFFGNLDGFSNSFNFLARMRSQTNEPGFGNSLGLSWPILNPSTYPNSTAGPWIAGFGQASRMYTVSPVSNLSDNSLALLDVGKMQITWKGTGIPAASQGNNNGGLDATYLLRSRGDLDVLYSNVAVLNAVVYPNQALVTLESPVGQAEWILVNSTRTVGSVEVNGNQITKYSGNSSLVNGPYAASGWSLRGNGTLLVRFQSSGQDVVRIVLTPPIQPNQLAANAILAAPFLIIVSCVSVDLVIWVKYIRDRTKRVGNPGS